MKFTFATRTSLMVIGLGWTLLLCGQTATPTSPLEGVWRATRDFGPAVRGTLDISRLQGIWHAQIAPYDFGNIYRNLSCHRSVTSLDKLVPGSAVVPPVS